MARKMGYIIKLKLRVLEKWPSQKLQMEEDLKFTAKEALWVLSLHIIVIPFMSSLALCAWNNSLLFGPEIYRFVKNWIHVDISGLGQYIETNACLFNERT